ncbi:MAG TPA: molybdopterin-dependent oxidoreductase [Dehalococcoidales bacterium]|nr:molybdopterin-dependent oxidoreductase [Dehalococcoidales bacterium]
MQKSRIFIIVVILSLIPILLSCSRLTSAPVSMEGDSISEALEYQGKKLTPLKDQLNNSLRGTQYLDKETYRLTVNGLVNNPLNLSYSDLLSLPQYSKLNTLNCVEGWDFVAKWTGPYLKDIFQQSGIQPEARIAIFYTADVTEGYTSLEIGYIQEKNIILALKINDITLPPERGFPFQVMAESKYGYKWAKWVTRIELSSDTSFKGYWEQSGYSNQADVGGPGFGN